MGLADSVYTNDRLNFNRLRNAVKQDFSRRFYIKKLIYEMKVTGQWLYLWGKRLKLDIISLNKN
jgi:hypothetical protein